MIRVNGKSYPKTILLTLLAGSVAAGSFIYAPGATAAQQFIESDGVTVVDVEPAFKNPDGTSGHHGDPDFLEANFGAFQGGPTGTLEDTRIDLKVPKDVQLGGGGFNIPTGAPPSPDFDVQPFTQKLLRFEEFGPEPLPAEGSYTPGGSFPLPTSPQSGPDSIALDTFLQQDIYPYPTRLSNTADNNPWKLDIETFLGRTLIDPPAEGRPPEEWWSHQRWDDFYPETYFQAAQAGARTNGGLRDGKQRHGYTLGEFGPGGLYHNTVGGTNPVFDGKAEGIEIRFHPAMPLQQENSLFTFDGTLPPKLLNVRYGEGVLFRHYNALPIDPSANNGFGLHTISTHEHNGHNPAESDGYTNSFFFPGQYYDYRWPIQLASYDSLNMNATDPKAAYPCKAGETLKVKGVVKNCELVGASDVGTIQIPGNYRETMSTHWFHDHMLDFTAQNVYKGNAAMMNYYSAIDRGNETIDDGVNLRFPSGSALDWGNRDYDVNLLIAGKAWDTTGQLFFNVFNTDGFLGDRMLVNWLYKPTLDVRARKYRFRLLNGSVSRYIKIALVTDTGLPVPFHLIANDGNIMEHSLAFPNGILPTQSIAERYDIIVDFSRYAAGTKIYLVNLMEHKNGRGPEKDAVPLAAVLDGSYNPVIVDGAWKGGDPVVGKFMEFNVVAMADGVTDQSMNPALYEVGGLKMIEIPEFTQTELDNAIHRSFDFGRANGTDGKPWTVKTDGGMGFNMDPRRISAAPEKGKGVEIWHMNTGGGWSHPIHVHFEEGQILTRDGMTPPAWETLSRKDVYRIGPEVDSSREVEVAIRFREFSGTYMEHCHNTQHEDTAMLMRWDIENPGQTLLLPTPMPTWDGVGYVDSHALATFRTGDVNADPVVIADPPVPANGGDVNNDGVIDRIFDDDELRLKAPIAMELAQVPDMSDIQTGYIKDPAMAIALGKALFWDQTVGSDGQACASCHFSAGADSRSKNQLSPGSSGTFEMGGINSQLVHDDYPFAKGIDEVVGSQGTFDAVLKSPSETSARQKLAAARSGADLCNKLPSDFSLGGLNYRKTTGRNAPSVINAVFNHRNFYDGRANNQFNGVDPHGARSNINGTVNGIWINDGGLNQVQVLINNSSLASQAVGPANNTTEMACAGRTFPLLGRKMLDRYALSNQLVNAGDSVLGGMRSTSSSRGLSYKYRDMIVAAFQDKYWNAPNTVDGDFSQMEANFSLFWGLAIQLYESTLVSDMTPFDVFARGGADVDSLAVANAALTEQQKLGLEVFIRSDRGACVFCHTGSAFTSASVNIRAEGAFDAELEAIGPPEPFERMRMVDGNTAVYDGGFYNIGVTDTQNDLCIGADVGGFPLSYSRQASTGLIADDEARLDAVGDTNDFAVVGGPVQFNERVGVDGACKTPSLRNVELTAPYFHNGGHSTLQQVMVSYMAKFKHLFADENVDNLAPLILSVDIQGLAQDGVSIRGGEMDALVAFLQSLTDERVRMHKAPFDHPALRVVNGSKGIDRNRNGMADDLFMSIPAVGAGGLAAPLPKFLE
ncbi:MAG: multicopper oxidase domain-containing protein [Gammaproteobacteria bacterium]|nr:multicopper oxidase domain-containing protein [Gammaproteobacteria bacterium]